MWPGPERLLYNVALMEASTETRRKRRKFRRSREERIISGFLGGAQQGAALASGLGQLQALGDISDQNAVLHTAHMAMQALQRRQLNANIQSQNAMADFYRARTNDANSDIANARRFMWSSALGFSR